MKLPMLTIRSLIYSILAVGSYLWLTIDVLRYVLTTELYSVPVFVACVSYLIAYTLWEHSGDGIRYLKTIILDKIKGK